MATRARLSSRRVVKTRNQAMSSRKAQVKMRPFLRVSAGDEAAAAWYLLAGAGLAR
jgi:hypothetical protein